MCLFFFQAEDGIRDGTVTGVQTCALPISLKMSVCSVPLSVRTSTPWRSAATTYMQKMGTAGPLIVIDVEIGRASCRERVLISVGGVAFKGRKNDNEWNSEDVRLRCVIL